MNSQEFIDVIKTEVLESSIDATIKLFERPPGRSPAKELMEMSVWYTSLSTEDKQMVNKLIQESARGAVFNFLCILDGVKAIENNDKGTLKLYYQRREENILLNDQSKVNLHELL